MRTSHDRNKLVFSLSDHQYICVNIYVSIYLLHLPPFLKLKDIRRVVVESRKIFMLGKKNGKKHIVLGLIQYSMFDRVFGSSR